MEIVRDSKLCCTMSYDVQVGVSKKIFDSYFVVGWKLMCFVLSIVYNVHTFGNELYLYYIELDKDPDDIMKPEFATD